MTRDRRSAFTLLELMIVLVILAILGGAFLAVSSNVFDKAAVTEAQQRINALSTQIESYRTIEGEYPRDTLPEGASTNTTNDTAEALFVALFGRGYSGQSPSDEWLVNTDEDSSTEQLTRLGTRALYEIGDPWGNPIVYIESLHYASANALSVMALEQGMEFPEEQIVGAVRDDEKGIYMREGTFQLISAGPDGWFGTEDDITNFD